MRKLIALFVLLFAGLANAQPVDAWIAPANANWFGSNLFWSSIAPPTSSEIAAITSAFTCTINSSGAVADDIYIAQGDTLNIDPGATLTVIGDEDLTISSVPGDAAIAQSGGTNTCDVLNLGEFNYGLYGIIGGSVTASELNIGSNGLLNIDGGAVYIHYGSMADPINAIRTLLTFASDTDFAAVLGGICSTFANNNSNYAIGYADSADPGNPANLPANTIKIMTTLIGDANLDGVVNGDDFTIVANHLGTQTAAWDAGDFYYEGEVNGDDFTGMIEHLGDESVLSQ